jgi:hypothetical protein
MLVSKHKTRSSVVIEDTFTYTIQIRGQAHEDELNAMSPIRVRVQATPGDCTMLTAHTDQAGCIGLIRYLHGLGFLLISIQCSIDTAAHASTHANTAASGRQA